MSKGKIDIAWYREARIAIHWHGGQQYTAEIVAVDTGEKLGEASGTSYAEALGAAILAVPAEEAGRIRWPEEKQQVCESCSDFYPVSRLENCPICGRNTCEDCRAIDEEGAFVLCDKCASRL